MVTLIKWNASQKNISMRCIFLYFFIGHLANLIPLIEYVESKENQIIFKGFRNNTDDDGEGVGLLRRA